MVQGEEEGPGDILDEELQKQLNEIADYDSDDATQPTAAAGQLLWVAVIVPTEASSPRISMPGLTCQHCLNLYVA